MTKKTTMKPTLTWQSYEPYSKVKQLWVGKNHMGMIDIGVGKNNFVGTLFNDKRSYITGDTIEEVQKKMEKKVIEWCSNLYKQR